MTTPNQTAASVNIGVVGAGTISAIHLKAYDENPRVRLVAIADIVVDRAERAKEKWGADRAYDTAEALFADPEIDAVSICTPNNTHAALAEAALRAGKHVLVEKPMAKTLAEAQQLQALVDSQDKVLQVGFVRRHSTNCRVAKQFIDAGDLGEIYFAKASVIRRAGNPGGWFADKAISGGGPLIDIGVHVLDLAWYLMGSPKAVTVSANTYEKLGSRMNLKNQSRYLAASATPSDVSDVEDLANALIRFENGASLYLESSYSLHSVREGLNVELHGTKGGAEMEPFQISTEVHDTIVNLTPTLRSSTFDFDEGFRNEIEHFVSSSLGEVEQIAPVAHGVEMTAMLDAVYESAKQGREITL